MLSINPSKTAKNIRFKHRKLALFRYIFENFTFRWVGVRQYKHQFYRKCIEEKYFIEKIKSRKIKLK